MTKQTASEVVRQQHAAILRAIQLLQRDLDDMTANVSPSTAEWSDVSRYAHAADVAREVFERYED